MNIGLDIHGVIDTYPNFFSTLTKRLKKEGHNVYIITGAKKTPELVVELINYEVVWDELWTIPDYVFLRKLGEVTYDENGNPWMEDKIWNVTKAHIAKELNLDFHIDDSEIYSRFFKEISPNTVYIKIKNIKK